MFVYFVRAGNRGAIKIGVARNMQRRLDTLQTGNAFKLNVIALIPCKSREHARAIEASLHKRFGKQRIRGEWFQGNIEFRSIQDDFIDSDSTASSPTYIKSDYKHIPNAKKRRQEKLKNRSK